MVNKYTAQAIMHIAHPVILLIRLKLIVGFYINRDKYKTMHGTITWAILFLYKGMLIYRYIKIREVRHESKICNMRFGSAYNYLIRLAKN